MPLLPIFSSNAAVFWGLHEPLAVVSAFGQVTTPGATTCPGAQVRVRHATYTLLASCVKSQVHNVRCHGEVGCALEYAYNAPLISSCI